MARDSIVNVTSALVQVLRVLNVLFAVLAILLMIVSFPAEGAITAKLVAKYGSGVDAGALIWTMRALGVLGLIGVGLIDRVLKELGRVLATLRAGDPFAAENPARFTAIAWALLGWQVLELLVLAISWWITRLGADTGEWTPSVGGWLSVLVAFVLARVFAAGSRMRDELAATI